MFFEGHRPRKEGSMLKLPTTIVAMLSTILLSAGCANEHADTSGSAPSPIAPASVTQAPPTIPPPSGSSFKNCRGGKNLNWWAAHIEDVTAEDLAALTDLNLTNADHTPFDPIDTNTLADWLKAGARTDEIFFAVSAQLAAAVLNVRHGFVHESATFVLVDQANRTLGEGEGASIGFLEQILFEFNRCQ
jgi:hypothetical protein